MTFSSYQLAIFDALRHGTGSIVVDAKAGAAKTTTIVEGLKCLPVMNPGSIIPPSIRFLAFNKSIAETLQARVPRHVVCSTFHSLGLNALKSDIGRDFKIEGRKVSKFVFALMDRDDPDIQNCIRLVGLAKNIGMGCLVDNEDATWRDLMARFEIECEDSSWVVDCAKRVLESSNKETSLIDFDDMLYLPVLLGAEFTKQDYIFVDEAQDTNSIQLEILARSCKRPTGAPQGIMETGSSTAVSTPTRVIAVGDPHQAIYGFRGANSDAMTRITQRFNATVMKLSVSYRCAKTVVLEARKLVPDIEPWEDSPLGAVQSLAQYDEAVFVKGSAILCRNTAPLVAFAYGLLQRDVPCRILGRDIGAQLSNLVKKMRAVNLEDFLAKLLVWENREVGRAINEGRSPESVSDQASCLRFFVNGLDEDSQTIASLLAKIDLMFTDDSSGGSTRVTLSTVHKSKGLEYHTVFILDRAKYMPSKYARLPWQVQQEKNLVYVAQTRAKLNLFYISSDNWKEEAK